MKYFVLENFDVNELKDLWDVLTECIKDNHSLEVTVISNWWEIRILERFIQIFDTTPIPVVFYAVSAASCAFELILNVKQTVHVNDSFIWMAHKWSVPITTKDLWVLDDYSKFKLDMITNRKFETWFLTKKELKIYNRWDDINIGAKRMIKIIEKNNTRK